MLLTSLLGDKQAMGGTGWEVDTIVYGIPSHIFVTKQQSLDLISNPSALLEYLDRFKPFVG